jgi:hypothetical protein
MNKYINIMYMTELYYKHKYLKYKIKYLELLNSEGGAQPLKLVERTINSVDDASEAINTNPLYLEKVDEKFMTQANVLAAVSKLGTTIEFAKKFKTDPVIIREAILRSKDAFEKLEEDSKANEDYIILYATTHPHSAALYNKGQFINKEYLAVPLVNAGKHYISLLSVELQRRIIDDRSTTFKIGDLFAHLDISLKADRNIVLEAVKQDGYLLLYASDNLKKDYEVVKAAFKQNSKSIKYSKLTKAENDKIKNGQ